jgi:hypothetical protein
MLSERDRNVLEFEASWWKYPGPKDRAIREYLGISATRYYQVLRRLVEDPQAMASDPLTVRRLQRTRKEAEQRAADRLFGDRSPTT